MSIELARAIFVGDASRVQSMVSDTDVNFSLPTDSSPLALAVGFFQTAIVKILLDQGAQVDFTGDDGVAPILRAFNDASRTAEHIAIVRLLLERGADINARHPKYASTVLHFAIKNHHLDAIAFLLDSGADPDACDNYQCTPFFNAVEACCDAEKHLKQPCAPETPLNILQVLINKGADRPARNKGGRSPLEEARHRNCAETAAVLASPSKLITTAASQRQDYGVGQRESVKMAFQDMQTKYSDQATQALFGSAIPNLPTLEDEVIAAQYNSMAWAGSEGIMQGSESKLRPIVEATLSYMSIRRDFSNFQVKQLESAIQVYTVLSNPMRFVPLRMWKGTDNLYLCCNLPFYIEFNRFQ